MLTRDPLTIIDNIPHFSPDKAQLNDGFSPETHAELMEIEEKSFWFSSRNSLIVSMIRKFFPHTKTFCEMGCGNGYVISGIHKSFPDILLSAIEIYIEALQTTRKRLNNANFFQADLCDLPYKNEFDLVGAFDVLEHIDDDVRALQCIYDSIKEGGGLIISVPQHMWLWSPQDDYACHRRRYSANEMTKKLKDVGFKVEWSGSFMFFLLPLMYLSRMLRGKRQISMADISHDLNVNPVVNYVFKKVRDFENLLICAGIRFPAGGSLMCIARK